MGEDFQGEEARILSDLAEMKPAFIAELARWHFKCLGRTLLSVNKPIYDLHALDTHL
jgi:hypothetical protein